MGKIGIIIRREYLTRVRKKSFLVLTILAPILFAALSLAPAAMLLIPDDERIVLVLDQPGVLERWSGNDDVYFQYANPQNYTVEDIKTMIKEDDRFHAALFIPTGETWDPDFIAKNIVFFSEGDVNMNVESLVKDQLQKQLTNEKLRVLGVDPELIVGAKTTVSIRSIDISKEEETETSAAPKMAVGFVSGMFIYFFIFIYGGMVMRSVIEEKTNRIVEVIVSSVKPFQLLMGKIIGVAFVGLTQLGIWVVLTTLLISAVSFFVLGEVMNPDKIAAGNMPDDELSAALLTGFDFIGMVNFPLIIACFLFYFLAGYLLYGALMAAVGSAVDSETDAQQFVLPVSIPLILAIIVMMNIITNPDNILLTWLSMIPLTSPIIMMARLPFGVPTWELLLSMGLLIIFVVLSIWMAGKIYRTGILMYGKKPTFKELFKWLFFRG
jgi:ABC-2 type transport system permease protein